MLAGEKRHQLRRTHVTGQVGHQVAEILFLRLAHRVVGHEHHGIPAGEPPDGVVHVDPGVHAPRGGEDRKSTRLNSSHRCISYAVFCLKKKKKTNTIRLPTSLTEACARYG